MKRSEIDRFVAMQLAAWPMARTNHDALADAVSKVVDVDGYPITLLALPARAASNKADIRPEAIAARPCFLCRANRPAEQQIHQLCGYEMLVNPYPIRPGHLTIVSPDHTPQSISERVTDIIAVARQLDGYTTFYNGPKCGASAPDHLHFQAVPTEYMVVWDNLDKIFWPHIHISATADDMERTLTLRLKSLPHTPADEPKVNILMRTPRPGHLEALIFPRLRHRPACFGEVLVSPGSMDMSGTIVTPRIADLDLLTPDLIRQIYSEVSLPSALIAGHPVPMISVGILEAPEVKYTDADGHRLTARGYETYAAVAPAAAESIAVEGVVIGKDFHWQQRQTQLFKGLLRFSRVGELTEVVNFIDVESYLRSVISSEMSADADPEFLKAHAVISRSWVLAQMATVDNPVPPPGQITDEERVMWYDRQNHDRFHVCADDHCQRYQGFSRAFVPAVVDALKATEGLVLTYDGRFCDARFSKCCGGATEIFSTCWQDVDYPYLTAVADTPDGALHSDLTDEAAATRWISSRPACFCGDAHPAVLAKALNSYDRTTDDYFRWSVSYTPDELDSLVNRKTGAAIGHITSITPLRRGPSGRIMRLRIEGTGGTIIIGKELEIRRALSESHLYSSAFIVRRSSERWTLEGAGWGHGVGLCQIGAAQMAADGYTFEQILSHYYPGANLSKAY
ncbi:MAG: DUF4922 domain-containing protein [Paramuribaculum sp.]|nr:DUF4922 domain-containing protein [Paramuribaculum sp.]